MDSFYDASPGSSWLAFPSRTNPWTMSWNGGLLDSEQKKERLQTIASISHDGMISPIHTFLPNHTVRQKQMRLAVASNRWLCHLGHVSIKYCLCCLNFELSTLRRTATVSSVRIRCRTAHYWNSFLPTVTLWRYLDDIWVMSAFTFLLGYIKY